MGVSFFRAPTVLWFKGKPRENHRFAATLKKTHPQGCVLFVVGLFWGGLKDDKGIAQGNERL